MRTFRIIFALFAITTTAQAANLVEILSSSEGFATLTAALKVAGLIETLSGEGPFTVLAPNDDAFAKIPKDELEALLANVPELKRVLLTHVISGKILSGDVTSGPVVTASGNTLIATVSDSGITFTNEDGIVAKVIKADILADNGVAHVIDTVL